MKGEERAEGGRERGIYAAVRGILRVVTTSTARMYDQIVSIRLPTLTGISSRPTR